MHSEQDFDEIAAWLSENVCKYVLYTKLITKCTEYIYIY